MTSLTELKNALSSPDVYPNEPAIHPGFQAGKDDVLQIVAPARAAIAIQSTVLALKRTPKLSGFLSFTH
jgi:hypothetical protein